ncbi:DUF4150 domain-containing protein [Rhizobacter sp. P5_C2]
MAVTIKVNGTSHTLVHKGSSGVSTATVPDVCKTPSPGGPVPIPYPNISQSSTLANGTTTVKADGGMMIAIKGSEFSTSNGDNAGTLGGVKSSTFMKESTWILYSFDVKMEGRNACRLTDKKLQNHGNTADMAGELQMAIAVQTLQDMLCECDQQVQPEPDDTCPSLGAKKHECMNSKISQNRSPVMMVGETAYNRKTGEPAARPNTRMRLIGEPIHQFFRRIRGNIYPDATILDDYGRPARFAEFKFQCPSPVPTRLGGPPSTGTAAQWWSKGQRGETRRLGMRQDPPITERPALITNEMCPS